ncbi:MAG: hypothetical protein KDJ45_06280 [Hyphomicrobiaceae bacterium]|nr:hypothetical protein [Hyphomicrobiaceae bacterium]MCC0010406.1 hypothetical protein [Hyphomicrobiaceae bacterium]
MNGLILPFVKPRGWLAVSVLTAVALSVAVAPRIAKAADLDYPPYGSTKDDYREPPPRFDRGARYEGGCAPGEIIRDDLRARGWRDFHDAERRGDVVVMDARRGSGRLFRLRIDRCTGEVLAAHRIRPLRRAYLREFHFRDWDRGDRHWRRAHVHDRHWNRDRNWRRGDRDRRWAENRWRGDGNWHRDGRWQRDY